MKMAKTAEKTGELNTAKKYYRSIVETKHNVLYIINIDT